MLVSPDLYDSIPNEPAQPHQKRAIVMGESSNGCYN
jgi:hypothetical protein